MGYKVPLGQSVDILDPGELPAEIFLLAAFARFSGTILASDGVHRVTQEYSGGAPEVLKHFIDLLKFPEAFER